MNRYFLRRLVFLFLYIYYLLIGRFFLKKSEVSVLMYHSIADSDWFFSVGINSFERQMRYLKKRCHPVSLSEVVKFSRGDKYLPSGSVAVTFDDGYKDFFNALPIIEKYQIPVTLFILAGKADRGELGNNFPLLSWQEIKEIQKNGLVGIASHAATHRKLARLASKEAESEIVDSRVIIEKETGAAPNFFAYPKGSFNKEIKILVGQNGYIGAVTAEQTLVLKNSDQYAIPRIQVDQSHSFFEFKTRLTAVADWYYKIWRVCNWR